MDTTLPTSPDQMLREVVRLRQQASIKLSFMEQKTKTAFIGSLARFEDYFGHLWGHGLVLEKCTPAQREMRPIWEQCRQEILDNGHRQVRALGAFMSQAEVILPLSGDFSK